MKSKVLGPVFGLAFALALSSCASTGNQSLRDQNEYTVGQMIKVGQTSKEQIRARFGSPMTTTFTDGGLEIWTYELAKMKADGVNYIPLVGLFGSSASGTKKQLVVLFNEKDLVKKFSMSDSPVSVKTGVFR